MSLKNNLVDVLFSEPARWVNFMHAKRGVAPIAFYHLAAAISTGRVKTKIDPSIQGRTAYYDPSSNTIIASDHDVGSTYWDEKALLLHEATHAILDGIYAGKDMYGKRAPMRVVDDELMAYIAGGLYLVAAGAAGSSKSNPEREAIKLARAKLNPRPKWDGCLTFEFTAGELQPLRNAIIADPKYRSDWSTVALHNGL